MASLRIGRTAFRAGVRVDSRNSVSAATAAPRLPRAPPELGPEPSPGVMISKGKPVRVIAYRPWRGLRQALKFIDAHLGERLTLVKIADEARLSPYHFAHIFKRFTGVAPHQYVMQRRLERAKHLLGDTDLPIADIAAQLGYASQSHFSEAFHHTTGVTPLTYRLHR
jgi:AraC-like DNA-binding protein